MQIYEYQFDISDLDRYMLFFGVEVVEYIQYTETSRNVPMWLVKLLNQIPFIENRFTSVFKRF